LIIDVPSDYRDNFRKGEIVEGHVLRELENDKVLMRLKGKTVLVASELALRTGMKIELIVKRTSPKLELERYKESSKQEAKSPISITV